MDYFNASAPSFDVSSRAVRRDNARFFGVGSMLCWEVGPHGSNVEPTT